MCRGRELGLGWRASLGVTGAFTATGVANRGIRRQSAAPGEYEPGFLNGLRRSVNRKVVGLYRETNGALRIARVLYLCMAQSP